MSTYELLRIKQQNSCRDCRGKGIINWHPIAGGRGNSASYFMPLDRKPVKRCHFGLLFETSTNLELANTNLEKGWFVLVLLFLKHWMRL